MLTERGWELCQDILKWISCLEMQQASCLQFKHQWTPLKHVGPKYLRSLELLVIFHIKQCMCYGANYKMCSEKNDNYVPWEREKNMTHAKIYLENQKGGVKYEIRYTEDMVVHIFPQRESFLLAASVAWFFLLLEDLWASYLPFLKSTWKLFAMYKLWPLIPWCESVLPLMTYPNIEFNLQVKKMEEWFRESWAI